MRARAGDPPRPMTRKILDAHAGAGDARVRVDHVVVSSIARARDLVARLGTRKLAPELSMVYAPADGGHDALDVEALVARGFGVGRRGAGLGPAVHLERFASPARVCVGDDPRLAMLGGAGMLALDAANDDVLVEALAGGTAPLPDIATVRVEVTGRTKAFVSASDVALALVASPAAAAVRRIGQGGRRVVVELVGPGVKTLAVQDRARIAAAAPLLGALAALFPADERMVSFLGDERRSKAHRVLTDDDAAEHDATTTFDLGAVESSLGGEGGRVFAIRERAKVPVAQVVLAGEVGASYRDLLLVAALLKSKRVPRTLDFVVAPPTRQTLEILAGQGALRDLVACGARIVEPDPRIASGELYPPPPTCDGTTVVSLVSFDSSRPGRFTAGPEALALAAATGVVADPRAWKRPPRVTYPRTLPTDDVLIVRGRGRAR